MKKNNLNRSIPSEKINIDLVRDSVLNAKSCMSLLMDDDNIAFVKDGSKLDNFLNNNDFDMVINFLDNYDGDVFNIKNDDINIVFNKLDDLLNHRIDIKISSKEYNLNQVFSHKDNPLSSMRFFFIKRKLVNPNISNISKSYVFENNKEESSSQINYTGGSALGAALIRAKENGFNANSFICDIKSRFNKKIK